MKIIIAIILVAIVLSGVCVLFLTATANLPDEKFIMICVAIIVLLALS